MKKLKKKSLKLSPTKRLDAIEERLDRLENLLRVAFKVMGGEEKLNASIKNVSEALEAGHRLYGAVHSEARDFVDYLKQARLEVDEFANEIKSLVKRTNQYSIDDNKKILLDED